MFLPAIFSLEGPELTQEEARFFNRANPFGFILFGRNILNPGQLHALTESLKELTGRNVPILIDQEGGRVQRLKPPHWQQFPAMQAIQTNAELEEVIAQIARELKSIGINTNCAPVMDLLFDETDQSIGDRAFSKDPEITGLRSALTCEKLLEHGIRPVLKHLPGHGRARVDSHYALPLVEASYKELQDTDFQPFHKILQKPYAAQLWGMVGHCCYTDIDANYPASLSSVVIEQAIRQDICFTGLLMSDDLSMGALSQYGPIQKRARLCLEAGCDIALYCAGHLEEMQAIASEL